MVQISYAQYNEKHSMFGNLIIYDLLQLIFKQLKHTFVIT